MLASCRGPVGALAVLDPVFVHLAPEAARTFASRTGEQLMLPATGASTALYGALDSKNPPTVYLSPLLASEVGPILSRDPAVRVAYLGNAAPARHDRLYAALFSASDAASLAGRALAREAQKLGPEARVAALFSGFSEAEAAALAFREAFMAHGALAEPTIHTSPDGYNQAAADRLKALDIRAAYISAPPRESERWAVQSFDPEAYIVIEQALAPSPTVSMADAFIAWDLEATLDVLTGRLASSRPGTVPGVWKLDPARRYTR